MTGPLNVLVIEDNPADFLLVERHLKRNGLVAVCHHVDDLSGLRASLAHHWDLVLSDFTLPNLEFEQCLGLILKDEPEVPVILVSGSIGEERAVDLFRLGVCDFVLKDNLTRLVPAIRRSLRDAENRRAALLAEQALIDSEERLRLTLVAAEVVAWDWDPATDVFQVSGPLGALFGRSANYRHSTLQEFINDIHPRDRLSVLAELRGAVASAGNACNAEFRIILPDGTLRWAMIAGNLVTREQGQPPHLLGIVRDITEHHEALVSLQDAKERAEAANVAKSQFLATMSHELRTPLNPIIGYSELLRMTERDPARRENLDIICETSKTLLRVIQDILDLSRIEAGKMPIEIAEFDLDRELTVIGSLFEAEARNRHLTLSIVVAPDAPRQLLGDSRLLRQVLVNLVGNALKFTLEGRVDLAVAPEAAGPGNDCRLRFEISDTGVGIRPENQQRIFEMFEQEDNSLTRKFGGTGLGLAICRRLVRELGGEIGLESAPGDGSRFFFTARFETAGEDQADNSSWSERSRAS